jgi:4-phytase/acid phosphatase
MRRRFIALVAVLVTTCVAPSTAQTDGPAPAAADLQMVVIVTRHGVRSPTDPAELAGYSARPWPAWDVAPGYLTAHGAAAITQFGVAYRAYYAALGLFPKSGCPPADSVFVWADVDERTKATGDALLAGLAPHCGLTAHDAGTPVDPLFHALPSLGKADVTASTASLAGSIGANPQAIVPAYALAFAKLDAILGCAGGSCTPVSTVPSAVVVSKKTGLVELQGAVDLASTAVEDFILAYADGRPLSEVGWGNVDSATLLELSQLHALKFLVNTETPYAARVQGSNLLAHVAATIDQGATGRLDGRTRAPLGTRFAAFVGHDTNLEELAGMLRLRWLLPGYQVNDTPPGGALVFEVYRPAAGAEPFVRVFFTAQSLEAMRRLAPDQPLRAPVFVPGCPAFDCPLQTFDRVAGAALDPAFVGTW